MDLAWIALAVALFAALAGSSRLRPPAGPPMSAFVWIGGIAAVGLFVYLVWALLRAEDF